MKAPKMTLPKLWISMAASLVGGLGALMLGGVAYAQCCACLLYTSDAADE